MVSAQCNFDNVVLLIIVGIIVPLSVAVWETIKKIVLGASIVA